MHLHLHHAIANATAAIADLSAISFFNKECNASELSGRSVVAARKYLARAAAELEAYDAERSVKVAA